MSREEAIEFGNMWLQINEDCKDSSTYTFFQMAIKALSQEPCTDAVSREAVMKIVDEEWICNADYDFRSLVESLEKLPSVNPQPICEEREKGECPYYAG